MTNDKWLNKKLPVIGLSPMDGITDEAFRLTQSEIAKPDLVFTEFVSAEGLAHNAVKLFDHLLFLPKERPIIAQLFGKDPTSFYFAALVLCHLGFDGIDINLGCPAKTVTQHGGGAALIDNPKLAKEIILSVKKAISDFQANPKILINQKLKKKFLEVIDRNLKYSGFSPKSQNITLSLKTRLGIDHSVINAWIPHLCSLGPDFITLHGRTLKQGYGGVADWDQISIAANLCHDQGIKIFGNGDLFSHQMALDYCQKYHTDGALIGRAALGNPWLFADKKVEFREKFKAMQIHARHFQEIFPGRRFDSLRRIFLLYISGHPHASALRQKIITFTGFDQLCSLEAEMTNC
jgi:tRNA-dihydrouridine synthase